MCFDRHPVPRPYHGWVLVAVLGIITIVAYGTTQYLFGVLVVPVSASLGTSRAQLSIAYSAGLVVAALLGFPVGHIVDRRGARGIMMAGSSIAAVSLFALSRAGDGPTFILTWSLGLGLAMSLTLYPVSFVLVANWFVRRRGSAMALLTTVGGFSSPIYIPLSGWLIATHGWRTALPVLALTQVAMVPMAAVFVRRRPEDMGLAPDGLPTPSGAPSAVAGLGIGDAMRSSAFWLLTVAGAAGLLGASALQVHQVPYMISHGAGAVTAASIAGVVGLASVPGRLVLNVLSQRVPGQLLMALSFTAMAAGVVVLLVATSDAWFAVYALVFGLGFGAVNPLRASAMADHFGRRAFGAISGTQNVAIALSSAVGPVLTGLIYDHGQDYRPALAALAAGFLLAATATALTPRPRGQPLE
jgi:MFS family permease